MQTQSSRFTLNQNTPTRHMNSRTDTRSLSSVRTLLRLLCVLMCGSVSAEEPKVPASIANKDDINQSGSFDPTNFNVVPPRKFEDLRVGEVFRAPSRTLTDAHASAFQAVSGDNHPIHYDVEYARRHGHSAPVVHGLQVLALTAPGATLFPQYIGDEFIAFTSVSCRFLKEVHAGDTLYPQLEIIKLTTQGDTGIVTTRATVHNQRGELVLDGEHTYALKASDKK
jgi:acyl dehydratase